MLSRSMTMSRLASWAARPALYTAALRAFTTAPSTDPLELMRMSYMQKGLCDESGYRLPGVHWTMAIAFGTDDPMESPNLRTVGIQRVSDCGADFVVKHGSHASFQAGCPVSVMVQTGRYVPGEVAVQWRSEGHCEPIPLEDILAVLPDYTIAQMVAAKRIEAEGPATTDSERSIVESTAHFTEIVQQVRQEKPTQSELEASIKAFRFHPDRMERMTGSPDCVLWERWQWTRAESGDCPEGTIPWEEPKALLPH